MEGTEEVQWRLLQRGETWPELGYSVSFCYGIYLMSFLKNCICLLLALTGLFSSCDGGMLSSCSVQPSHCSAFSCCSAWAPGEWASVVLYIGSRAPQLWHLGFVAPQHVGSSRIRDQTLYLLHQQVDSSLLSHQGSPLILFLNGPCQSLRDSHLHNYLPQQKLGGVYPQTRPRDF